MDAYTLERIIISLERTIAKHVIPPAEQERKKKCHEYEYIPLGLDTFARQIAVVKGFFDANDRTRRSSFIDVGCGIGTKVALARSSFSEVSGVEITKDYVDVARRLFREVAGHFNDDDALKHIHCADALTFNYKPYNVIYFYCPLMSPDIQCKLEERLVKTAPKDAYFLANNYQHRDLWASKKVKRVWGNTIFQKV